MKKTLTQEIEMLANFMEYEGQHEEWCGNNILVEDRFSESGKSMIPYNPNEDYNQLFEIIEAIEAMGYFHTIYRNVSDNGRAYSGFKDRDYKQLWEYQQSNGSRLIATYQSVVKMVEYLIEKQ